MVTASDDAHHSSCSTKDRGAVPSPLAGEGARRAHEGYKRSPPSRARALRKDQTEAEKALWRIVRDRRFSGFKFRRQFPMGRYIVDFICLERRLIVEADGSQHAENSRDEIRDAWLTSQDFTVLRFWNSDILARRSEVAETIWAALAATPHPPAAQAPSPARGEGERHP